MAASPTTIAEPIAPSPPRKLRPIVLRLLGLTLLFAVLVEPLRVLVGTNLHVVVPGAVYRAGQPSAAWLTSFVRGHGIRTIVNLRGTCYPQDWYLEEAQAVQDLGISLEDICLSAGRLPSPHEMRELVQVIDAAERPLLLHCRHGSDRTGLAAVVVLLLEYDGTLEQAWRQLSPRFGHLPVGRVGVLNQFFEIYKDWLKEQGQQHERQNFRRWLMHEYRGGACQYRFEEVVRLTKKPRVGHPVGYQVKMRNTSAYPWRFKPGSTAGMHLGYFLWSANEGDEPEVEVGRAAFLDTVIMPGEVLEATVVVRPLPRPGVYRVRIDMVEEGHCWFYQTGAEPYAEEFIARE